MRRCRYNQLRVAEQRATLAHVPRRIATTVAGGGGPVYEVGSAYGRRSGPGGRDGAGLRPLRPLGCGADAGQRLRPHRLLLVRRLTDAHGSCQMCYVRRGDVACRPRAGTRFSVEKDGNVQVGRRMR